MNKKTSTQINKVLALPVQELNFKSLKKHIDFFDPESHDRLRLILKFEIDLTNSSPNYYLVGYMVDMKEKIAHPDKIILNSKGNKMIPVAITGGVVTLGDLRIKVKRLEDLKDRGNKITFTPKLYPNPHIGYDANSFALYPSPPAPPVD